MANSPSKGSEGVVRLTILCNGNQIQDSVQIMSVEVEKVINSIPVARLVILDGDMPNKEFPVSDASDFAPGSEVTIKAGYADQETTIFEGIVVKHNIKISGDNFSRLNVECRDKAVAMTIGRKNQNYVDSKDSDIFTSLIGNYSGLSADVTATSTTHKEIVQYYCTDWDFLVSRADVNGALVIVDDAKVSVDAPSTSGSEVLSVTYGEDLLEFHAEIDARAQYKKVKSVGWDPTTQKVVSSESGVESLNNQGNLSNSKLADVIGLTEFKMQTPVAMESAQLSDWAKGQQVKSGLSKITGRMKFQGNASAKPGTLIALDGVGNRFNGNVFVSAIHHVLEEGNWFTEVDFGMSDEWFLQKRDVVAPLASGLLPGVEGLHIGIVVKLDEDPENQNRIKVKVPVLEASTEGVWARLSNYYASNGFGEFFIPEINDEVILGYLNNDPSHPVILGSVYSAKNAPPYSLTSDNFTKAIVTKSKLKVEFDDDKKVITLETPGGNKIEINDDGKSILIQDQTSNEIKLSESGITIESPKDISLKAGGSMSLKSTGELSITSDADVSAAGMNIGVSADIEFTAEGGATAEVSSGGNTTIKGSMVMIN